MQGSPAGDPCFFLAATILERHLQLANHEAANNINFVLPVISPMRKFLAIILLLMPFLVRSQAAGLVRIELDAAMNSDIYQVVPCGSFGVLVFFETKDAPDDSHRNWHFLLYGKDLEEIWNVDIPVMTGARFKDYNVNDSLVDLFFLNTDKVKPGSENFQVVRFDLAQDLSSFTRGILPSETNFKKVIFNHNRAYLALNMDNDEAGIYIINLLNGEVIPYNIVYPDQNFIEDICLDTLDNQLLCLIGNFLDRRQNKMYLQAIDLSGQFRYDMEVSTALAGKYLNSGRIFVLRDSSIMILGSYGSLAAKIPSQNEYFGIESSGVFSTCISHREQKFMNYYNFMEFNNLRAGVSARDFYRLQKKKVRETPEYSLNYELLFHEPIIHDTTQILMLEAFYPEFKTVSDISYDYWGRPVTQTYTVFDGYRLFNTILAAFDDNGALVWDNSLELNLNPTVQLMKRASYYFDGDPSVIFYNDGYRIDYRVYIANSELEGFSKVDIETSKSGDKITTVGFNSMKYWYDKYFLAYGYQSITNNLVADKNERTVFYINKIALD